MEDTSAWIRGWCVGLMFGVVGLLGVLAALEKTPYHAIERMQIDAVKHGAATWSVNESGKRVFAWKERKGDDDDGR